MRRKLLAGVILCFSLLSGILHAQDVKMLESAQGTREIFLLQNENVACKVIIRENHLECDSIVGDPGWLHSYGALPFTLCSDANFGLQFTWTDWQAPKKVFNADNPVTFDKDDFEMTGHKFLQIENGSADLEIDFHGTNNPLLLKIIYHLDPGAFFIKRKVAVLDTTFGYHFLEKIYGFNGRISGVIDSCALQTSMMFEENSLTSKTFQQGIEGASSLCSISVIKSGDFGQPVAFTFPQTGAFYGLEYPASVNLAKAESPSQCEVECSQDFGIKVGKNAIESDWVVEALVPTVNVKDWFFKYMNSIRVAADRIYTLYNSWYDLRSPEFPKVQADHIMNAQNIFNIISLFRKNIIEKHGIKLDAFVLDDGWDVYQSDWVLRKETFPNGLKPIADTLQKLGTSLGLWIGPTGGYSFRMKRIDWMKSNGYETVGKGRDYEMLCMGGKNYSALFRKRVIDFASNEGVGYFKWDGIQFACSEPDHGHPVGIYSRRAILDSLISKCQAVRDINKSIYLNITSGTWLSPWWVKYANQVWMQGADYGYADVPSISERDAAITYKDFVLYDDFKTHDCWYPVSNLMTHGIIKGNLERLGGEDDPLDKFTNDAVFYVARGISMIELYISPDLLKEGEWNAIGKAINWARDRHEVLSNTYMTGGDPSKREPYGYVHFKGSNGILTLRNPFITPVNIRIHLSSEYGLDPQASNLVLEKIYPYRWISPKLYSTGIIIDLPLEGYECAVYELYPLQEAKEPLVCGVKFDLNNSQDS
ncbi:MAG: alpha-galactosidase, partial [Bacteroidales bacterium]